MKNYPQIAIVFPNYNGGSQNLACLTSIRKLNYPKEKIEVIVVDNNSSDGSDLEIKKKFPKAKLIKNQKNFGFAKAVNLGTKKAKGRFLLITNNDVIFEKDCILNLVNFLEKNPGIGVTGPIVFEPETKKLVKSLKYNLYTGLFAKLDKITDSDWISGAGMFLSKKLWKKLAGFDEGFFFTFEDLDFCLRAKKMGVEIRHCPKAQIFHRQGSTVNKPELEYFKYYQGYKSKLRLILKHGNIFQILLSFLLQFLVFAPYRFLILGEKSFVPLIDATFWNFKNLSKTLKFRGRSNGNFIK